MARFPGECASDPLCKHRHGFPHLFAHRFAYGRCEDAHNRAAAEYPNGEATYEADTMSSAG